MLLTILIMKLAFGCCNPLKFLITRVDLKSTTYRKIPNNRFTRQLFQTTGSIITRSYEQKVIIQSLFDDNNVLDDRNSYPLTMNIGSSRYHSSSSTNSKFGRREGWSCVFLFTSSLPFTIQGDLILKHIVIHRWKKNILSQWICLVG